jgi:hypothetical protein
LRIRSIKNIKENIKIDKRKFARGPANIIKALCHFGFESKVFLICSDVSCSFISGSSSINLLVIIETYPPRGKQILQILFHVYQLFINYWPHTNRKSLNMNVKYPCKDKMPILMNGYKNTKKSNERSYINNSCSHNLSDGF